MIIKLISNFDVIEIGIIVIELVHPSLALVLIVNYFYLIPFSSLNLIQLLICVLDAYHILNALLLSGIHYIQHFNCVKGSSFIKIQGCR